MVSALSFGSQASPAWVPSQKGEAEKEGGRADGGMPFKTFSSTLSTIFASCDLQTRGPAASEKPRKGRVEAVGSQGAGWRSRERKPRCRPYDTGPLQPSVPSPLGSHAAWLSFPPGLGFGNITVQGHRVIGYSGPCVHFTVCWDPGPCQTALPSGLW